MGLDHRLAIYKKEKEIINFEWRKKNHIHGWFIEKEPEVNNGTADINSDIIVEFYNACMLIIEFLDLGYNEIAKIIMPPTVGFFFGNQKIDKNYKLSLEKVRDKLKPFIEDIKNNPSNYHGEYWSWW